PDQQKPAALIFPSDIRKHLLVDITRDESVQRRCVGERLTEQRPIKTAVFRNIIRLDRRIHGPQAIGVGTPEEGKRRDQRARADAGHQLEFRHLPTIRPAAKEARTEGAVITATRNSKKICRWKTGGRSAVRAAGHPRSGAFALQSLNALANE